MKTAYLSTIKKSDFYFHLGYTVCQPVNSLRTNNSRVSKEFVCPEIDLMHVVLTTRFTVIYLHVAWIAVRKLF